MNKTRPKRRRKTRRKQCVTCRQWFTPTNRNYQLCNRCFLKTAYRDIDKHDRSGIGWKP